MSNTKNIFKTFLRAEHNLCGLTTAGISGAAIITQLAGQGTSLAADLTDNIFPGFGFLDGILQIADGFFSIFLVWNSEESYNKKYLYLQSTLEILSGLSKGSFSFLAYAMDMQGGLQAFLTTSVMTTGLQLNVLGFMLAAGIDLVSAVVGFIESRRSYSESNHLPKFNDDMLNIMLQLAKFSGWGLFFCGHPGGLAMVFCAYLYQSYNLATSYNGLFAKKAEQPNAAPQDQPAEPEVRNLASPVAQCRVP
jgi:hypothetical protein